MMDEQVPVWEKVLPGTTVKTKDAIILFLFGFVVGMILTAIMLIR